MSKPNSISEQQLIESQVTLIRKLLDHAAFSALKAHIAITSGSTNEAIGWLIDGGPLLKDALALFEATMITLKHGKGARP